MLELRTGTSRRVLIVGPLAFKFARGERGRRGNLAEARIYRTEPPENVALLCPVLACSPGGRVLVMRAASSMDAEAFEAWADSPERRPWSYSLFSEGDPTEEKASSFGYLDGRVVAVDYAGLE